MFEFNYEEELEKAERNLKKGRYADVGRICGIVFENILKDLYFQIKYKADEESLKQIKAAEKKLKKSKGIDTEKITIGQMLGLFRDAKLFDFAGKILKKDLKITKLTDRDWLATIRNRCSHPGKKCDATPLEVKYLYYSVILILEELGYFSDSEKQKCFVCGRFLSKEWNSCPSCSTRIKLICPECGYGIEKDYKGCPKCNEPLYILSKKEGETFIAIREHLSKIYTDPKETPICPVCRKVADIVGADGGDGPGTESIDYGHECVCETVQIQSRICDH